MENITFFNFDTGPKRKIWAVLWDDATYRQWTSLFVKAIYAVSDWKEGSKIHFYLLLAKE